MPTSASPPTHKGFDYASLDAETTQFVQQQTGEIRVLMKRTAQSIIKVGQKLIEVKEKLGHGQFLNWLSAEFEWSWDTAKRFMRVAEVFGNNPHIADFNLAPTALYELAAPSTPLAAREEALSRAEAGESITSAGVKALKQKYALPPSKPKPEPKAEPVSQPQPSPIPEPPPQLGALPQIVMIRRHVQVMASAQPLAVPQPSVPAPAQTGVWWKLGGQHLLYCGDPNSPEFLEQIASEKVSLMLAFPPTLEWHSRIRSEVRLMMADYLPQFHNPEQLDEALESAILLYSRLNTLVVSCFLPKPEILSIINRLERRGLFAEPDSKRCNEVISDWKRGGLKAERLA